MSVDFLEETPGNKSSMRLMCMASLVVAAIFGAMTLIIIPVEDGTGLTLCAMFLVAAFAPKAVQKFAESKVGGLAKTTNVVK